MTSPARTPLTGLPVAGTGRRSAALAAWATAVLQRRAPLARAVAVVTGSDEPHLVGAGGDLAGLVADLRERGAAGLRLVLPVPGDPRGLPGPGPLTDAALRAGEAVVAQGAADGVGWVPHVTRHGTDAEGWSTVVRWQPYDGAAAVSEPRGTLRQTEHDLADALREAAQTLSRLDAASLSPAAAARLAEVRSPRPLVELPPSHPGAAQHLLQQAERLAVVLEVAGSDDGAAVDRGTAVERSRVLREFAATVRRARVVAVNAPLDDA